MDPDAVIAPPYDVVTDEGVQALLSKSQYSIAHIEMRQPAAGNEHYTNADAALQRWQDEGVMLRDKKPAYYLYEQRFTVQGALRTRRCFFARLEVSPPEAGRVLHHESTMTGPLDDRLRLLRATETNVSPILAMFEDPSGRVRELLAGHAEATPDFEATDDHDDRHRLWVLRDGETINALTAAVDASAVTIADGHHRYQTALNYQSEHPSVDADWMLAGLIPADDPGLIILPVHRLVKINRLPEDFMERLSVLYEPDDITPKSWDGTAIYRLWGRVQANAMGPATFGILGIENQRLHVATGRSTAAIDRAMPADWSSALRSVDAVVLTETMLRPLLGIDQEALVAGDRVVFTEDVQDAWSQTESGRYSLAFLVNPVRIEEVLAVANAGEVLPQKSTYFYPKLATGLVLNPLD